jgi:prepilin signal peptidase PulO-like enzyme (type II secretory pathway)
MIIISSILIFILGAAIGSFLSVVIYRLHKKKKGIILSRSICTSCKKQLKWRYLIPIFSWLFLKGKCGYCGKKISVQYLAIELTTGLIFLVSFLNWNFIEIIPSTINSEIFNYLINWKTFEFFLFYIIEFTLLTLILFYDLLYKEIPDKISLPAISIAIAGGIVLGTPSTVDMLIGGGLLFSFFAAQFFISRGKWIGGGDLRLGALMGVILGWEKGLLALVLAYLGGAIVSIFLLAKGKVTKKTAIAFGPFLAAGAIIAAIYGNELLGWYFDLLMI